MKEFIQVMKALSDPNRVKILKMLNCRELCVCEIQAGLGLEQPSVSKHHKILEYAVLLEKRKNGLWVNYRPDDGQSSPYAAMLLRSLEHRLNDDPEIQVLLHKVPRLDRGTICAKQAGEGR